MVIHTEITPEMAFRELERRKKARGSLVEYARNVHIPGVPVGAKPARHHEVILRNLQWAIETGGRLMIFAPPGSAKSSFAAVAAPTWAIGRYDLYKVIVASYAASPAYRHSRRARTLVESEEYRILFPKAKIVEGNRGVDEWEVETGSGVMAVGILGAVTSARADLLVIDDPVAGREEADSETVRRKTWEAYQDDLMTRISPDAAVVIIQTRWSEDDLSGKILPVGWDGESGDMLGSDGRVWRVLRIPAEADRPDDPLKRKKGEMLWPERFPPTYWDQFKATGRTWGSLYQQLPKPETGGQFEYSDFQWYETIPDGLKVYGASDWAVTSEMEADDPDYSEHGVFGVDHAGHVYVLDWWHGRTTVDVTCEAMLDLAETWKPRGWYNETGVIRRAVDPLLKRIMRSRGKFLAVDYLPTSGDKVARIQSFRGLVKSGMVHFPKAAKWSKRVVEQLCGFPYLRHDDVADVCGNFGRALEKVRDGDAPKAEKPKGPVEFSYEWFALRDKMRAHEKQVAEDYYR